MNDIEAYFRGPRLRVFKEFTTNLADLSKCIERHVAAIITDANLTQIYSIGINGGPKGLDDCLCVTDGKYGCLHAEINALIKCTNHDPKKCMFVTLAPCKQCAAAIINAPGGFGTVYYFESWKEDAGIKLLKDAGIHVACI
jgi:deoxycytidylate deaminase